MAKLQGLERGLLAVEILSQSDRGLTIAELAVELGIDRSIVYRIVETLESHALVSPAEGRRWRLGPAVVTLAERFQPQLIGAAEPVLQDLADTARSAAFLTVSQGPAECLVLLGAEPREHRGLVHVGYRIGARHPLTRGANGVAILAAWPPRADESTEVAQTRERGYAMTANQLETGATGVAVGFVAPGLPGASIGVVTMDDIDVAETSRQVRAAVSRLTSVLGEG